MTNRAELLAGMSIFNALSLQVEPTRGGSLRGPAVRPQPWAQVAIHRFAEEAGVEPRNLLGTVSPAASLYGARRKIAEAQQGRPAGFSRRERNRLGLEYLPATHSLSNGEMGLLVLGLALRDDPHFQSIADRSFWVGEHGPNQDSNLSPRMARTTNEVAEYVGSVSDRMAFTYSAQVTSGCPAER